MKEVIGVRFKANGKVYYFDPGDFYIPAGTDVIVDTARGLEYGKCVMGRKEVEDEKILAGLKPVLRVATPEDTESLAKNKEKSAKAYKTCNEKIREHNLDMKLISAEYTFDGSKVLFYFTADGRVDFRELVRDLASVFKTRIELRQIGVRDEAKVLGGLGVCGRDLCCYSYLPEFIPVSIKMAKEQNLSLNQPKISGVCGRLMCCLKYEQETYEYLNARMPSVGDIVANKEGVTGKVDMVNVMRQTVRVIITDEEDNKIAEEFSVEDLTIRSSKKNRNLENDSNLNASGSERGQNNNQKQNNQNNQNQNNQNQNKGQNQGRSQNNQSQGRNQGQNNNQNNNQSNNQNQGRNQNNNQNNQKQGRNQGQNNNQNNNQKPGRNQGQNNNQSNNQNNNQGNNQNQGRNQGQNNNQGQYRNRNHNKNYDKGGRGQNNNQNSNQNNNQNNSQRNGQNNSHNTSNTNNDE